MTQAWANGLTHRRCFPGSGENHRPREVFPVKASGCSSAKPSDSSRGLRTLRRNTYADRYLLKYEMACSSISSGITPNLSQSPGTSTSSMYRRITSSGLNSGHQTFWAAFARASATDFGTTGAREGGLYVTVDTRVSRYSYVNVDGPGRLNVPTRGCIEKVFASACATSRACVEENIPVNSVAKNTGQWDANHLHVQGGPSFACHSTSTRSAKL